MSDPVSGLPSTGADVHQAVCDAYDLNPAELVLLGQLCATVDEINALSTATERYGTLVESGHGLRLNPAVAEITGKRKLFLALVTALALPDMDENEPETAVEGFRISRSESGRKAARTRRDKHMKRIK